MNILKRIFSRKKEEQNSKVVKANDKLSPIESSLSNSNIDLIIHGYENRLSWWNDLEDDWKRLLMMKSNLEDPMKLDISITPTKEFLVGIFEREIFHNMWQPITTLKPLNYLNKLKILLLEFLELKDFSDISEMQDIEEIIADNSKIESLEGLENYENLKKLSVCNTDVNSLKPIATLKNLQDLDIRGTLIHPQEYEYFKQLHPKTNISFITPMNPLRRGKESLENPLLDYYRNLLNI